MVVYNPCGAATSSSKSGGGMNVRSLLRPAILVASVLVSLNIPAVVRSTADAVGLPANTTTPTRAGTPIQTSRPMAAPAPVSYLSLILHAEAPHLPPTPKPTPTPGGRIPAFSH